MTKKFWLAFVAVFVVDVLLSGLIYGLILGEQFRTLPVWRPDMNSLQWIYYVLSFVGAFFFTFIFAKGYEGKGILEGVRYGLYIGIWMSLGMAYGTYGMVAIPYGMTLEWFLLGVASYIVLGIVAALIYGKKQAAPAA